MKPNRLFVCTNFKGRRLVGTSAVIVAPNEQDARTLLLNELDKHALRQDMDFAPQIVEISLRKVDCHILQDGDY